jgi:hypothetical protein
MGAFNLLYRLAVKAIGIDLYNFRKLSMDRSAVLAW